MCPCAFWQSRQCICARCEGTCLCLAAVLCGASIGAQSSFAKFSCQALGALFFLSNGACLSCDPLDVEWQTCAEPIEQRRPSPLAPPHLLSADCVRSLHPSATFVPTANRPSGAARSGSMGGHHKAVGLLHSQGPQWTPVQGWWEARPAAQCPLGIPNPTHCPTASQVQVGLWDAGLGTMSGSVVQRTDRGGGRGWFHLQAGTCARVGQGEGHSASGMGTRVCPRVPSRLSNG